MIKNLLRLLFLCVALFLSIKAFVALIGYQAVESFREQYGDSVSVSYGWISSGTDGSLVFEDVVVTPFVLKRSFTAKQLKVDYGHFFSLMGHLGDLKSSSLKGVQRIVADGITAPLEGRDVTEWLAETYRPEFAVPLALYACGDTDKVSEEELRKMGIEMFKSGFSLSFADPDQTENIALSLNADLNELGRVELDLALNKPEQNTDVRDWPLEDLRFKYVDNGYLRRLANLCEQQTGINRTSYAQNAALSWARAMQINGVAVNEALVNAYFTFLSLGGGLVLDASSDDAFTLRQLFEDFDRNLFEAYGINLELNKVRIENPELVLVRSHFHPESLVKPEPVEVPKKEISDEGPQMLPLSLEELDEQLGRQLSVTLLSGKVLEGVLQSSDQYSFELVPQVGQGAGKVAYTVQREDVQEILMQRSR